MTLFDNIKQKLKASIKKPMPVQNNPAQSNVIRPECSLRIHNLTGQTLEKDKAEYGIDKFGKIWLILPKGFKVKHIVLV